MFYFYVLENEMRELYYGSTNNLKRRLVEHQQGKVRSTKGHDWVLIYYEAYQSNEDARQRERQIKHYGQALVHLKTRIQHSRRL
jgi:putative endonuclease